MSAKDSPEKSRPRAFLLAQKILRQEGLKRRKDLRQFKHLSVWQREELEHLERVLPPDEEPAPEEPETDE